MDSAVTTLLLVSAIAAATPLLADWLGRFVAVPLVVFEILLGVLVGPAVLGWAEPGPSEATLASYGLSALFLLAGLEIDFARIGGRVLRRSLLGWLLALAVATGVGMLLAHDVAAGVFVGVALTSTALGTLMPVLRDAGELSTPFGAAVIGIGAVGEFGPLIAISLFLSGRNPGIAAAVLVAFVIVAGAVIAVSATGRHRRLHRLMSTTLHTSGQFAVRFVVLVLAALVALSLALRLEMLLGAFAAGVVVRLLLSSAPVRDRDQVMSKIEAIGFGFLVPVFFVDTGLRFDLAALRANPAAWGLMAVFLALFLLIRGVSGLATVPDGASASDRRAIVLLAATGLPIIVAVSRIGSAAGDLPPATASALVGAGMLSVLAFPALALGRRSRPVTATSAEPGEREVPDEA